MSSEQMDVQDKKKSGLSRCKSCRSSLKNSSSRTERWDLLARFPLQCLVAVSETSGPGIVIKSIKRRGCCASRLKKKKKDTNLKVYFDKRGRHGVRESCDAPPPAKGPLQPYRDPNSNTTSSIRGSPRVPTKFKTTQLVEPPSSSPAHQHPIPQKTAPFNRSRAGPGVFAALLIQTYVRHIETQGLPFSIWETMLQRGARWKA